MVRFTLATMVTATLLVAAGVPSVHAGSALDPEILDGAQDVNPAAFATHAGADNETIFDEATAYDVVKAWIGAESATHFMVFIQVHDLPDDWGPAGSPPPQSPFGTNASFAGTSLVANFSVAGNNYWAIAKLAYPGADAGLQDNYTLWRGGEFNRALSGAYSLSQDLIQMRLPKAAFLGLGDGVKLEKFWVEGRFGSHSMDFAPNAKDPQAPSVQNPPDPLELAELIADGQLVQPQYGRDYAFGQYYRPPTGGPNPTSGPIAPNLVLRIEGASDKTIRPGEAASYDVYVQNLALGADTVYLTLSSASQGWDHSIEQQSLVLESGQARLLYLDVRAAEGASGGMRTIIDASSQLGGSRSASVLTMVAQSASQESPSPDDDLPVLPAPSGGGDSPSVAAIAVVLMLAAVAVAIRRGTR